MIVRWPALAVGVAVVVLGAAGLIRGAMPQSVAAGPVAPGAVTVTGAYVVAPVAPTRLAAAYFTVYNTTASPDRLEDVQTGAGASAELHTDVGGVMSAMTGGAVIPAHGKLVLSTGQGHVMIGKLFGTLAPGQTVDMSLDFAKAGTIDVVAPVIKVGTPPPTGVPTGSVTPSSASDSPRSGQSSTSTP